MNAWEGLGSSIISAVIAALVAVLVVHLSNASARRSWYHQRRIEAFAEVLDGWNQCWDVTRRNWDSYPQREEIPPSPVTANNPDRAPIIDQMLRRDQDLLGAVQETAAAIDKWSLYLATTDSEIEKATRRALDVLYGEWDFTSYEGRGGLYLPIDGSFHKEWDAYMRATHEWHRTTTAWKKRGFEQRFASMWKSTPKTKGDILAITTEPRFSIE